ncbi:hypothetical protein J7K91_00560 [bacterium]|nr:hypothetical protein [bacterium]
MEKETLVGEVTHYFTAIGVAVVKVKKSFKKGARLHIKGATTDFYQEAASMQINHQDISEAPKGKEIGLKVDQRVREGDKVYLVEEVKEKKKAKTSKGKKKAKKKAKKASKKTNKAKKAKKSKRKKK